MRLLLLIAMAGMAFSEDVKAPVKEAPAVMTEVQSKDIQIAQQAAQIIALQKQILDLQEQLQRIRQDALVKDICTDKKIPFAECSIDPATNQVTRKPAK